MGWRGLQPVRRDAIHSLQSLSNVARYASLTLAAAHKHLLQATLWSIATVSWSGFPTNLITGKWVSHHLVTNPNSNSSTSHLNSNSTPNPAKILNHAQRPEHKTQSKSAQLPPSCYILNASQLIQMEWHVQLCTPHKTSKYICSTLSSVFHRKYDPQAKLHSSMDYWQILSGPFRETVQLWQAWKCTGKEKGEKVQWLLQSLLQWLHSKWITMGSQVWKAKGPRCMQIAIWKPHTATGTLSFYHQ